jgi:hypothetical protein
MTELAKRHDCPLQIIGTVGGDTLRINLNQVEAINARVEELERVWRSALPQKLVAQAMAAGRE